MGLGGPILALTVWTGLENTTLTGFVSGREAACTLSGCLTTQSAEYCMLVNEWAWLRSQLCLLRLEVEFGTVLESELGQK